MHCKCNCGDICSQQFILQERMKQLQIVPCGINNRTTCHPPKAVNQGYKVHKVSHFHHLLLSSYCAAWKVGNMLFKKANLDRENQPSHPPGLMKCSRLLECDFVFSFFTVKKDKAELCKFFVIISMDRRLGTSNLKNMLSAFVNERFHILIELHIVKVWKSLCCWPLCLMVLKILTKPCKQSHIRRFWSLNL